MESFGKRLYQTGEPGCRKKTNNKWFETQDQIGYTDAFSKQLIVWKAVGRNLTFCLWGEGKFLTAPASFMYSKDSKKYLLAYLHSSYAKYYIINNADSTGAGDVMLNIQSILNLRIPILSDEQQQPFIELVDKILLEKQNDTEVNTSHFEAEINKLVYCLYNLTEEEIAIIEN